MRRVKITVKISRYQRDKMWGELYRHESMGNETFTEFKRRRIREKKDKAQ